MARCASFCVARELLPALLEVAGQVPLGLALGAREILAALLEIRLERPLGGVLAARELLLLAQDPERLLVGELLLRHRRRRGSSWFCVP